MQNKDELESNNQVLNSGQVAELLGVSPATVRSWKARKSEQLEEGVHFFNDNNQTFWTQQGIEALNSIKDAVAATPLTATPTVADDATPTVAEPNLQRYTPLVEAVSAAIAPQIIDKIDEAILKHVKSAFVAPMTSQECAAVLTKFGLAPANPNTLLGSQISGYLGDSPNTQGD